MIIVKTDQEPAIKELQEEIARQRRQAGAIGTILGNSKVGDIPSNGRTERSIQEVGGGNGKVPRQLMSPNSRSEKIVETVAT